MHAGKGLYTSCGGNMAVDTRQILYTVATCPAAGHSEFCKSKTSSRFPNFDDSNTWQLGHDSPEGISLGQELLLDFAAWLDLTLNADDTITVYQLPSKFQNTF